MRPIAALPRKSLPSDASDTVLRLRRRVRDNIRVLASERGFSMQMVADLAGVSRSQLFNVLGCRASPRLDWLAKVAAVFDVDVRRLLDPCDPPAD